MYQEFYGLKENPFSLTPDPQYLYLSPRHKEALAQLYYGVTARKGFMVLVGEVGLGKTLLLNKLLHMFEGQEILSAYVFNTIMTPADLFEYICADLGIECNVGSKSHFLLHLNDLLIRRVGWGKATVLIVDEAQNLSREIFEELRMLTNLEMSKEKLLQIVLAGQPELGLKLDDPSLRQLKQRVALRATLKPFTFEETTEYIYTRLQIGGLEGDLPFTYEALRSVHALSGGIPRIINNLCDNALLAGYARDQHTVDDALILAIGAELQLTEPAPAVSVLRENQELGRAPGIVAMVRRLFRPFSRFTATRATNH